MLPLVLVVLVRRLLGRVVELPWPRVTLVTVGGSLVGGLGTAFEHWVLRATGLSLDAAEVGVQGAVLATFLFAAPLGQGLKVGVVWPLYRSRTIGTPAGGMAYAAAAAGGYAAARTLVWLGFGSVGPLLLVRLLLGVPAHLFFAGLWGYALGSGSARGRWFSAAWLLATLLHGLYEHIVFGRGPGLLVASVPLLLGMATVAWVALRDAVPTEATPVTSSRSTRFPTLPAPPSIGAVRRALSKRDRPLMLRWIAAGAFVTLGAILVALTLAVLAGRQLGIDFSVADEGDVRSTGPLLWLGAAFLAGFPAAGYLVARASGTAGMLEPALGAALAIAAVVALVSMASPASVVFALAVAPVAFALACGGTWLGMAR